MAKFVHNDIVCFFFVEQPSFLTSVANLELCVVFFVTGMRICFGVGHTDRRSCAEAATTLGNVCAKPRKTGYL